MQTETWVAGTNDRWYWVDADGVAHLTDEDYPEEEEPSCSICDALGHGYPGGGSCPLEDRGEDEREYGLF